MRQKQITYTDTMELSILHFAYNIPIYKLCKKLKLGELFVGSALSLGMKDKNIMRMVASINAGNWWEKSLEVKFKNVFSRFQ